MKRGKKRRKRFSNTRRAKANRQAVKKYNEKNPHAHREASKKYNESNPQVTLAAVRKYNSKISQTNMIPWSKKSLSEFHYNLETEYNKDKTIILGPMMACQWCKAMKWKGEAPGLCCNNGKVYLPLPKPPSETLYSLHSQPAFGTFSFEHKAVQKLF